MWSIGDPLILWRFKYAPPPSVILPNLVILDQTVRMYLKDSVKETNKFHIYETEEITRIFAKPVTRQNISSCSVLSPEIIMHDTFNAILWTSADICVVVHDDLGWKNRTTRYILPHHWLYEWFSSAANVHRYMHWAWRSQVKEPNNML